MRPPASALLLPLLLAADQPACGQSAPEPGSSVAAAAETAEEDPVLAAWGRVLAEFVRDGGVDYAALEARPEDLETYLASLAAVRPRSLGEEEALAFWSNAYNAVVLHHVLEHYPGLESVRDVDGFFDRLTFPVAGAERTLDEIETQGRELGDPRVHFAVVCASTSCPDLLDEPFRPAEIDDQLDRLTRRFLADESKGMRYDAETETLWLSSIFKWYAGDFTGGSTVLAFFARGGVADWVRAQLPPETAARIAASPRVRYLDYDWALNDRPAGGSG